MHFVLLELKTHHLPIYINFKKYFMYMILSNVIQLNSWFITSKEI